MKSVRIDPFTLEFHTLPEGPTGQVDVRIRDSKGQDVFSGLVRYRRDRGGIQIHFPDRVLSWEVSRRTEDDGVVTWQSRERSEGWEVEGIRLLRSGEAVQGVSAGRLRSGMKVKSQMPGKILKCSVLVGDLVEVGAPLLVMEAMKMENEIRAPLSGRIKSLSVSVGSLVETGSVLLEIEKA